MQNKGLRELFDEQKEVVSSVVRDLHALRQDGESVKRSVVVNAQVLAAVVSLMGEESVQAEVERLQQVRQEEQETQMANNVADLKQAGVLKEVAETAVGSFVVGRDENTDGSTNRVQFELRQEVVPPDVLPKFLGKKVGDVIENAGIKLTVLEVYEIDKAKSAEYQENRRRQTEEAVKAASAQQVDAAPPPADDSTNQQAEVAPQ